MADDTIFSYDNIIDLRYNPFTGVYTPKKIGYGIIPPEVRTVPTTAPYQIKLYEHPQENVPSTTNIETVGGTPLREVSFNQSPASGEYRVCYDELGNGIVEFNSAQKGVQMNISYYGLGSILQKTSFRLVQEAYYTKRILELENNKYLSCKVIDIGDWNMDLNGTKTLSYADHGFTLEELTNIRSFEITIRNDANDVRLIGNRDSDVYLSLINVASGDPAEGDITLSRKAGGLFDSVNYDSTSYNRGWVMIWYKEN
jgi:hypothetical protein